MMLANKEDCTGCAVCKNVCPRIAIHMVADEKGFCYPEINNNLCVNCGLCAKKCPVLITRTEKINSGDTNSSIEKKVYAVWNKNKSVRLMSSSGGLFSALAEKVLEEGGLVCATRMSEDCRRAYIGFCKSADELDDFRGSKYVQSTNDAYKDIKKELLSERRLLFVGTGCQITALKTYLGKEYDNLICIDLVCHGVPSPGIWADYLSYLCDKHREKGVKKVNFRSKAISWRVYSLEVIFDSGKKYAKSKFDDPYLIAFTKDFISRPCCEHCQYATINRTGDLTLSDFWGYQSIDFKSRNDNEGISCCIINTERGKQLFDKLDVKCVEKDMNAAIRGNRSLIQPWNANEESEKFWDRYKNEGIPAMIDICKPFRFPLRMKMDWFVQDHLYLVPYRLIKKIRDKSS